ncbi:MAG: 3-deoxy-7-phosphoheptulonate synthase, partial [Candidatus Omnitrophica bacterium]|nr:3-deoxy-7-phosphoheptulonate synthase [Candidatus Omnitrophota bacterium]
MIIVLRKDATEKQIEHIIEKTKTLGLRAHVSRGVERTIIGLIGPEDVLRVTPLEVFPGVEEVMPVLAPFRLVSREFKKENTKVTIRKDLKIGDKKIILMAGPCSVENKKSLLSIAKKVKESGATVLRGGAFKPRTSPYEFQGLGEEGLKYLKEASEKYDIATVSEVMDPRHLELMCKYVDILQVGARNMQNFMLLREIGMTKKPVL